MFVAHAGLKYFVFTPAGTVGFFESLGLPGSFAYLIIGVEFFGGLALLADFYTRYVSLALVPVLLGAIYFVHGAYGWLFSNENGGWEFIAFWIMALIVQALLGDGIYAIKHNNGKIIFTDRSTV